MFMPGVRWGAYRARFYTRPGAHSMPRTGKKKPTSCIATSWATLAGPPSGESVRPAKNSGRGKKSSHSDQCMCRARPCLQPVPPGRAQHSADNGLQSAAAARFCALHLCGQHHKGASAAARALEENPGQKKACDPWGRQASILDSKNWYWRVLRLYLFRIRANIFII